MSENYTHKWDPAGSFYLFITQRYISRPLVPFLIKLGIKNPNVVSIFSFVLILISSALLLLLDQHSVSNRIIAALLIEFSLIFDCADGQMARQLNKETLFGGWLDTYVDRIGEMVLYTVIGYITWMFYGSFIYFILGVFTGYLFTCYSIMSSQKDSLFLEEIMNNKYQGELLSKIKPGEMKKQQALFKKRFLLNNTFGKIVTGIFFFLNIGTGERYFYPVVFIILNKTNIMLIIVSVLFTIRAVTASLITVSDIMRNKSRLEIEN